MQTTKKIAARHTAWQASTSLVIATFIATKLESTPLWGLVESLVTLAPGVDGTPRTAVIALLGGLLAAPIGYLESYAKSSAIKNNEPYDPEQDFRDIGFQ